MRKKFLVYILMSIFITSILLGCRTKKSLRYESSLADVSLDGVTADTIELDYWTGSYFEKTEMPDKTYTVMNQQYTGTYSRSIVDKLNSYTTDFYRSENTVEFGLRSDTGQLVFINLMTKQFFDKEPYLDDVANPQDTAIQIAREIAAQYVTDIDDYDQLPQVPTTQDKEKDGVTYTISYYIVTFAKKIKGYYTSDYISVKVSSKGNLCSIIMGDIGAFDDLKFSIEPDLVAGSVRDKTEAIYKEKEYLVTDCDIGEQKLVLTPEGDFAIYSNVDVWLQTEADTSLSTRIFILTKIT